MQFLAILVFVVHTESRLWISENGHNKEWKIYIFFIVNYSVTSVFLSPKLLHDIPTLLNILLTNFEACIMIISHDLVLKITAETPLSRQILHGCTCYCA